MANRFLNQLTMKYIVRTSWKMVFEPHSTTNFFFLLLFCSVNRRTKQPAIECVCVCVCAMDKKKSHFRSILFIISMNNFCIQIEHFKLIKSQFSHFICHSINFPITLPVLLIAIDYLIMGVVVWCKTEFKCFMSADAMEYWMWPDENAKEPAQMTRTNWTSSGFNSFSMPPHLIFTVLCVCLAPFIFCIWFVTFLHFIFSYTHTHPGYVITKIARIEWKCT